MRLNRYVSLFVAGLVLLAQVGCSSNPPKPATYTVKRGDTLYSIAWRHRVDYQQLANWNGIGRDYVIHPGQVLRLTGGAAAPKAVAKAPVNRPKAPVVPANTGTLVWQWPITGSTATLTSRPNGGQGLTISGKLGAPIRAASDGRVVYSGTGLLGYGQLLIVKHNDTYLSAYGHTQSVSVHEGDPVRGGEQIATMGAGPQGTPMLYFEIRVNGVPVNPLTLLPQR